MKQQDIITKTFSGTEKMLPILVNIFIKEHKDYVLTFQTPVMKTFLGLYQTTITMQKVK